MFNHYIENHIPFDATYEDPQRRIQKVVSGHFHKKAFQSFTNEGSERGQHCLFLHVLSDTILGFKKACIFTPSSNPSLEEFLKVTV